MEYRPSTVYSLLFAPHFIFGETGLQFHYENSGDKHKDEHNTPMMTGIQIRSNEIKKSTLYDLNNFAVKKENYFAFLL